jgi:peptide-methionine (R)-S-oxide reductase
MNRRVFLGGAATGACALVLWQMGLGEAEAAYSFTLSEAEWKKRLSPLAFNVLRREATEHPFTSPLNDEHRAGIFACAGCAQPLFSSKTKFDSGTGWPSFWAPLPKAIGRSRGSPIGDTRVEVHCSRCGGHLGHVFDDGPRPTGKRYCMNGVALAFRPG